ncbi:hypothetical protein SUDANB1_03342 [Streptomyces sp. enrichment culture]|uniref:hypothetical protein n=1 Tax=Streptomyces sp. enrichment culture TaxID=1795815 RepID=UPI003F564203
MARRALKTTAAALTAAASLLFTACGGGGSDSSDDIKGADQGAGQPFRFGLRLGVDRCRAA